MLVLKLIHVNKGRHSSIWANTPIFELPLFIDPDKYIMRRHQMKTFSALLVLYAGNSPVTGEFGKTFGITGPMLGEIY